MRGQVLGFQELGGPRSLSAEPIEEIRMTESDGIEIPPAGRVSGLTTSSVCNAANRN
jgi:hypothetical protein